jgi:hypothetical protein
MAASRKALDHVDDLVPAVALEPTKRNQFTDSLYDEALLGSPGHGDAPATLKSKQSLVSEDVQGPQNRVLC